MAMDLAHLVGVVRVTYGNVGSEVYNGHEVVKEVLLKVVIENDGMPGERKIRERGQVDELPQVRTVDVGRDVFPAEAQLERPETDLSSLTYIS